MPVRHQLKRRFPSQAQKIARRKRVQAAAEDVAQRLGIGPVVRRGIHAWVLHAPADQARVDDAIRGLIFKPNSMWRLRRAGGNFPVWGGGVCQLLTPGGGMVIVMADHEPPPGVDSGKELIVDRRTERDTAPPSTAPSARRIEHEPTRWFVPSSSQAEVEYVVDSDYEGGWACTCDGHLLGGHLCKHIKLVRAGMVEK